MQRVAFLKPVPTLADDFFNVLVRQLVFLQAEYL